MNDRESSSRKMLWCADLSTVAAVEGLVRITARDDLNHFFEHFDDANCRDEKNGGNKHHQHSFDGYDR